MALSLHRFQSRLWRARRQSFIPAVTGARWISSPQSQLSDIEVNATLYNLFFSLRIVLMSVSAHSMEG